MLVDKYSLYYFDFTGRAEGPRIIFKVAGVEFNDVRISFEEFAKQKQNNTYPFQVVPFLEKGDFKLNGTAAICQYLGKTFKLWPESLEDEAKALSIFLAMEDTRGAFYQAIFYVKGEEEKAIAMEKAFGGYKKFEGNFLRLLGENKFIFGDKFNIVDFLIFEYMQQFARSFDVMSEDAIKYYDRCAAEEQVANYLKK
jgi:prostaglandin-H2 D-isomerase / glutathione transferase